MYRLFNQFSKNGFFSLFLPFYLLFFANTTERFESKPIQQEKTTRVTAHSDMMVTVNVNSNSPICAGATLDLTAAPAGGVMPYTFAWTGPNGFSSILPNPSIIGATTAATGNYTVVVTDGTLATASATIAVTVNAPATVNAGTDRIVCYGTPVLLNGSIGGGATSAAWTSSIGGGTFSPNASTLNATYTPPSNFVGLVTLTLTTNDPPGPCGPSTDQMTINYGDPEALVCNDVVQISLDEDCSVTVTPDMVLEGDVLDPLYTVTIFTQQGQNIGNTITSAHVGAQLKARVTDNCTGNFCFTDINVVDALPPVLNCQDILLPCVVNNITPAFLENTLGIAAADPVQYDNCGPYTSTYFDTWVDVPCNATFNGYSNLTGYVRRLWTVKDPSNNTSNCTQYLYFTRVLAADLEFPIDVTLSCNDAVTNPLATGVPYYEFNGHQFPLYPDEAYCSLDVSFSDNTLTLCPGTKAIIREWQVYDNCLGLSQTPPLNPLNYTQLININDTKGPLFVCPGNQTTTTDALDCCATFDLPDAIVEDMCSYVQDVSAVIITTDPITGDTTQIQVLYGILSNFPGNNYKDKDTLAIYPETPCLAIGTHQVVYIAEDACGVTGTCTFNLTITDGTPPLAVCDEYTQVSLGIDGMIFVDADNFDDGSYDNCGPVYFKARRVDANGCQSNNFFYDEVKFCCEDVGDTIEVQMRVYDQPLPPGQVSLTYLEQHANDCIVEVYVDDKLKPVCIPPSNVTVTCTNFDPSLWAHGMPSAIDNCCLDTITQSVNYNLFDTLCNRGTIVRSFRAYDCYGNSNQCTQRIVVNYEQSFYVKFPDDVIITACSATPTFGQPTFFGEDCELLAVSYDDVIFTVTPDACMKIERTWTVINWCGYNPNEQCIYVPNPSPNPTANHPTNMPGPIVSPFGTAAPWAPTSVRVNPTDPTPTNYSQFYNPNANCYKYKQIVKIIDNEKPVLQCPQSPVNICDVTDNNPSLWHEPYWSGNGSAHDLCEAPVDLCVTATDACAGANLSFRYLLFLDLNNDGIMETVVNSNNLPGYNTVNYGNAANPNYSGGTPRQFDERAVNANQKYGFALQTLVSGNNMTACVRWNTQSAQNNYTVPELPYGTHKIKWYVSDGCGNETVCEYTFVVRDCKAPTIVCKNGLSSNIMPTGMVEIFASFFLEDMYDNCDADADLKIGIRKSGTGTGFPFDAQGNPITSLIFSCQELGTQLVELWAIDESGNADYCETYIIVQDNAGNCTNNATIAGVLNTPMGYGLEDAGVEVKVTPSNGLPPMTLFENTNTDGGYHFSDAIPMASTYVITPIKDDNPMNGISTYDIVLINKHILGSEPFDSPSKMIAADINRSTTITTFDIVELRKLILGIYSEFPDNTSWRFVDKGYTFPNPNNPFVEAIPESKSIGSILSDNMHDDFLAIKVGDVNHSNTPNQLVNTDDRNNGTLLFDVKDRWVSAGEIVEVELQAADPVQGFQFTLNYDNMTCLGIVPGESQAEDNFAVFHEQHAITTSWDAQGAADMKPAFKVQFRAEATGKLSQLMHLSSRITKTEAYGEDGEYFDLALRFQSEDGVAVTTGVGFELYQNQPNPFINKTTIGFHLPEATEATLSVYDEMGRTVLTQKGAFERGYNQITIDAAQMENSASLLYYRLETQNNQAVRKMVRTN